MPMLGYIKVRDLTTSEIRAWHKTLAAEVGWYSANRAKMFLSAVLALAAEDLNIRPPAMPANLGRGKPKIKKAILALAYSARTSNGTTLRAMKPPSCVGASLVADRGIGL